MNGRRIRPSETRQAQRFARLVGTPHEDLTPSEREEKRDLIDKWAEEPDHDHEEDE